MCVIIGIYAVEHLITAEKLAERTRSRLDLIQFAASVAVRRRSEYTPIITLAASYEEVKSRRELRRVALHHGRPSDSLRFIYPL